MEKYYRKTPVSELLFLIIINIVSVYISVKSQFDLMLLLEIMISINIIGYYFVSAGTNFFVIDTNKLIVRNSLRPWAEKVFRMSDIKSVCIKSSVGFGYILFVEFRDGESMGWSSHIHVKDLDRLVLDIKKANDDQSNKA